MWPQRSVIQIVRPKNVHRTFKIYASDLQKLCIRPTKGVDPTYKKCPSDLQKVYIRPTKECASDPQVCVQPEQRSLWQQYHLHTNKICSSCVGRIYKIECTSNLQLQQVRCCSRSEVSYDGRTVGRKKRYQFPGIFIEKTTYEEFEEILQIRKE